MMATAWDQRYTGDAYAYGTQPNEFLRAMAGRLPPAPAAVLSLAEGEGRNGVYLAGLGYHVTGVDSSEVGLAKAQALAGSRGVSLSTVLSNLGAYEIAPNAWDAVVSIFCHLPAPLRQRVHRAAVQGLRSGGVLLLEAYTPGQLEFRTGGPPTADLLYTADMLRSDFAGMNFEVSQETEREVIEGTLHHGHAAVVQVLARKS